MGKIRSFAVLNAIFLFAQITSISTLDSTLRGRLLTPVQGCGISKVANTKIIGGTEAKPGEFPWIALIGQKKLNFMGLPTNLLDCGGALITSRHVLTAAHCITPYVKFVRLGEHDVTTTTDGEHQDIQVLRSVRHPNYSLTDRTNDIGIITLEKDVEFTDRIRPICLPLTKELQSNFFVDSNPFVAGWGNVKENNTRSDVLMKVQLPVLENKLCEELYRKQGQLRTSNQFSNCAMCAGNLAGGQDACQGDSGGPLMLPILENGRFSMYQIGVVNYGIFCGRPNSPGVYARVTHFMDWIKSIVDERAY